MSVLALHVLPRTYAPEFPLLARCFKTSRPERPIFGGARPFSKALRLRNFYARG